MVTNRNMNILSPPTWRQEPNWFAAKLDTLIITPNRTKIMLIESSEVQGGKMTNNSTLFLPRPQVAASYQRKVEAISVWMGTASVESRSEQWGKKPDKKHYNLQLTLNE